MEEHGFYHPSFYLLNIDCLNCIGDLHFKIIHRIPTFNIFKPSRRQLPRIFGKSSIFETK